MVRWMMSAAVLFSCAYAAVAQELRQEMFQRIFGGAARLGPALVAKVAALPPGCCTVTFGSRSDHPRSCLELSEAI